MKVINQAKTESVHTFLIRGPHQVDETFKTKNHLGVLQFKTRLRMTGADLTYNEHRAAVKLIVDDTNTSQETDVIINKIIVWLNDSK